MRRALLPPKILFE